MTKRTHARPVADFPAYYATPDGKVFTTYRGWRELSQSCDRDGYRMVHMYRPDRTRGRVAVHKIILTTFVGAKPSATSVCRHLNGNPADNRADNLAWGTQSENIADAVMHGTAHQIGRRGEEANGAKLTELQALEVEQRASSGTEFLREIARDYDISIGNVAQIRDHKTWRHLWANAES